MSDSEKIIAEELIINNLINKNTSNNNKLVAFDLFEAENKD